MRFRVSLALAAVILLLAGCSGDAAEAGFGCQPAPIEQRNPDLAGVLSLSPSPVTPGATAVLTVAEDPDARTPQELVGWGATWECWNGDEWVATHLLEHGGSQRVVPGVPGQPTTMPLLGIPVPGSFSITIPDVAPGWYRISERGADVGGHVPVEVAAPD